MNSLVGPPLFAFSRLWKDCRGQEMLEYGLLAGFLATVIAAFVPYQTIPALSTIYSKIVGLCSTLVPY
jgi:Flp pilus assembly pilin Flp